MRWEGSLFKILCAPTVQQIGNETAEVWQAGYINDYDREFYRTVDNHYNAVIKAFGEGSEPPIHAIDGLRALLRAYAVIESYEADCRVLLR